MKPTLRYPKTENDDAIQRPYFPACCDYPCDQTRLSTSQSAFKKKKFISLSKNIEINKSKPAFKVYKMVKVEHKEEEGAVFEEDKSSFLQQIRKYNPNPEQQKEKDIESSPVAVTMNTSKETPFSPGSPGSNENNLSTLLQNLNNEMFSDMFVSSQVKGRIILSGSLGSITEVKSDMEMSCPSEPFGMTPQNTDRTYH